MLMSGAQTVLDFGNPTNDDAGIDQDAYMKYGNAWVKQINPAKTFINPVAFVECPTNPDTPPATQGGARGPASGIQ
jgi:hypothetical protein